MPCILLVDDDEHIIRYLELAFSEEGYEVVSCAGGAQALEIATQFRPDLIILDAMMPRIDGYQVLWHLRDRPETQDIPAIMLTSRTKSQDRDFGLRLGAQHYIAKPFSMENLLEKADALLHYNPLQQQPSTRH